MAFRGQPREQSAALFPRLPGDGPNRSATALHKRDPTANDTLVSQRPATARLDMAAACSSNPEPARFIAAHSSVHSVHRSHPKLRQECHRFVVHRLEKSFPLRCSGWRRTGGKGRGPANRPPTALPQRLSASQNPTALSHGPALSQSPVLKIHHDASRREVLPKQDGGCLTSIGSCVQLQSHHENS